IAFNVLRDFLRRRRRYSTLSLDAPLEVNGDGGKVLPDLPDRSQDPAERLLRSEWSERLHVALERLPPAHRACLMLLHQERSYQEIGALLNCPLGTVRSRIHRARVSLRQALQTDGG